MNKEFELAVLSKLERIADALEGVHGEMKTAREERAEEEARPCASRLDLAREATAARYHREI